MAAQLLLRNALGIDVDCKMEIVSVLGILRRADCLPCIPDWIHKQQFRPRLSRQLLVKGLLEPAAPTQFRGCIEPWQILEDIIAVRLDTPRISQDMAQDAGIMIFSLGNWFDFDPWLGGQELRKGGQLLGSEVFEDREGQDWPDAKLATDSLLVKLRRAPKISGEHPLRRQDMLDGSDLASRLPHLRDIEYEVVCIDIVDKCLPRHIKYASPH